MPFRRTAASGFLFALSLAFLLGGCQTTYFDAMEKVGWHKRDILVKRVNDARIEQELAKEQFLLTLEYFRGIVHFSGGDLEAQYKQLQYELDKSEKRALALRERITAVQDVADALFAEWAQELSHYSSADLRRSSEEKLRLTRQRYDRYLAALLRAEAKLEPVLRPFRDQVLYLKHNLNARAIASLQNELGVIEADVHALISDLEASIREGDAFLHAVSQP